MSQPAQFPLPARAVVLVAGLGSRLGARTIGIPKCLVEVNGTPILVNMLRHLAAAGLEQTELVVGYRAADIRSAIGDRVGPMAIHYGDNPAYRTTGTSRSLAIGLGREDRDVLVLEGDVFFERAVLDCLLASPYQNVTVVERWRPELDGSVVTLTGDGVVNGWIHKKDRPAGFSPDGTFKTVNLHRFSRTLVATRLRPALAAQLAADGGREPIETVFAQLIRDGARIHAVQAPARWAEIDDEAELLAAEALFQRAADGHR